MARVDLRNLSKHYPARDGNGLVKAVNDVSLSLEAGRTLGIVGESGCGKSTLARLILRLIEPTAGAVLFNGENLVGLASSALRRRRRDIQIVFQDPYASLDPRMNVAAIIAEPLDIHGIGAKAERNATIGCCCKGLSPTAGRIAAKTKNYQTNLESPFFAPKGE